MKNSTMMEKFQASAGDLWPVAKGSVRKYQPKCKRKECCRCQSGEGHPPVWEMTYYQDGKQRSKHIPLALVDDVKSALENGRKLEALLLQFGLDYIDELKASAKGR